MVSIHIVPVIVCLIIKVISSTFRFKCGVDFGYQLEGCGEPNPNKRYNAPHPYSAGHGHIVCLSHTYTRNECYSYPSV